MSSNEEDLAESLGGIVKHLHKMLSDDEFRKNLRTLATAILQLVPPESTDLNSSNRQRPTEVDRVENSGFGEVSKETDSAATDADSHRDSATASEELTTLPVGPSFLPDLGSSQNANHRSESSAVRKELGQDQTALDKIIPAREAVEMLSLGRQLAPAKDYFPPNDDDFFDVRDHDRQWEQNLDAAGDERMEQMGMVRQRCRLKSEAARWAAQRRRLIQQEVDWESEIDPNDRDLIARARQLPDCFLWTNNPAGPEPEDLAAFDRLAESFELLADAIELAETTLKSQSLKDSSLPEVALLVAESQSSLRKAVIDIGSSSADNDQRLVYQWLRDLTSQQAIYLDRYMRVDDEASPANSDDLARRIAAEDAKLTELVAREKDTRRLLGKIRFEVRMISESNTEQPQRFETIMRSIEELVPDLVKPSNVELRSALMPVVDLFEEAFDLPQSTQQVLREIDLYLARNPAKEKELKGVSHLSPEVARVSDLMQGRSMFMIGGQRRPQRQEAIRQAFRLRELVWESVDPHTSLTEFLPSIGRPDVAVVLLAIRWSSHGYADIEKVCREHGKPLVRLPGGTNANQIAHQVLLQAGSRLSEEE